MTDKNQDGSVKRGEKARTLDRTRGNVNPKPPHLQRPIKPSTAPPKKPSP